MDYTMEQYQQSAQALQRRLGDFRPRVLLILGAVAFVLLLFCNVPEEAAAPADAPAQKGGYDWRIIVPYVLVFGFYFIAEHGVMNWMVAYGVDGLGLPQASAAK